MKAIIMAGGKGTRLRPITEDIPKPMTRVLGKPLMEHIIELLAKHGFNEICVTLGYKPEKITEYFGNGEKFGVSMQYRCEDTPLGTAGGIRACTDFYGDEDFLVISGDAACDFDLSYLIKEHQIHGGSLTMALFPHDEPLSYGTVLTEKCGNVINFIEKPNWERVVTDLVNTGIYIVTPKVMELVPQNTEFDFSRNLFPILMERNMRIIGIPMKGYWCDIGNCKSYHQCSMDALDTKLKLNPNGDRITSINKNKRIINSVICRNTIIGMNSKIEHSIIHPNSYIGENSEIVNSVIDGGTIGENSRVFGAVACNNSKLSAGSTVYPDEIISGQSSVVSNGQNGTPKSSPHKATGYQRKISCSSRARLMRELSSALWETGADFNDGISLKEGKISLRISPVSDKSEIEIEATGGKESSNKAICDRYCDLAEELQSKKFDD